MKLWTKNIFASHFSILYAILHSNHDKTLSLEVCSCIKLLYICSIFIPVGLFCCLLFLSLRCLHLNLNDDVSLYWMCKKSNIHLRFFWKYEFKELRGRCCSDLKKNNNMNWAEKLPNSKRELLRVVIAMSQFIIAIEKWQQDVFFVKTLTDDSMKPGTT